MNVLLLTSHSIAEYDDLRMLTDLGYLVFSIGAYTNPWTPTDDKRPPLRHAPSYPYLAACCENVRRENGDPGPNIDWAKARLHPDIIDWADVIIVHHFPERWIGGQWSAIKHKRVIWRTCGQSSPDGSLERYMATFRSEGMEIVRYSPRERSLPNFAGEDALIRFGKYPADYGPWGGEVETVGNVTQNMAQRGNACGYGFWLQATDGLPTMPAGPGSEALEGGIGSLPYDAMLRYLRALRAYLYTGTQPASYTLGLMEAMLSGVPVVSIGAQAFGLPDLFEAATRDDLPLGDKPDSIVAWDSCFDDPQDAKRALRTLLDYPDKAATISAMQRQRAIDLFGIETVGPQWKAFLG
jgi:hypothetical protein